MKTKIVVLLVFLLAIGGSAFAQGFRIGDNAPISSSLTAPGVISTLQATVNICNSPANAVPCTNKATTYTSVTLGTPCSTSTQVVLAGTSTCVAQSDARGNWGAWISTGTYDFTFTIATGQSFGPYTVTVGIPTGSSLSMGALTTTGPNILGGATTAGIINGIRYVPLVGSSIAATMATCPSAGCTLVIPDNYTETFTTQIQVGTPTQTIDVIQGLNTVLTCNISTGVACIVLRGNSSWTGSNFGGQSGTPAPGGSLITWTAGANITSVFTSSFPVTGVFQEYFQLSNVTIAGPSACTATLTDLLHLEQIFVPSSVSNITMYNFCGSEIGLNIVGSSGGSGGIGNINLSQIWATGNGNGGTYPGGRPYVISSTGGSVANIQFYGGAAENVQTNGINIEINGNGHANAIRGLLFSGTHVENQIGTATGVIGWKITDANDILIQNPESLFQSATETAVVSINQSAGDLTQNITIHNLRMNTAAGGFPLVVNNITSESITNNLTSAASLVSYTFSNQDAAAGHYWSGNNTNLFGGPLAVGGTVALPNVDFLVNGNATYNNRANSDLTQNWSSGSSGTQNIFWNIQDQGTTKYSWQKTTANNYQLIDSNNLPRISFLLLGNNTFNSANGATDVEFQSQANSGTGGVTWWSGGASPTKVGTLDSSGNVAPSGHLNQSTTGKYAGSCTMAGGTTCTFSIAVTFAGYLSFVSIDHVSVPPVTAISANCSLSGTTVTITAGASNSLTWDCLLIGNPN